MHCVVKPNRAGCGRQLGISPVCSAMWLSLACCCCDTLALSAWRGGCGTCSDPNVWDCCGIKPLA